MTIKQYLAHNHETAYAFAKRIGIPDNQFYSWKNEKWCPGLRHFAVISEASGGLITMKDCVEAVARYRRRQKIRARRVAKEQLSAPASPVGGAE